MRCLPLESKVHNASFELTKVVDEGEGNRTVEVCDFQECPFRRGEHKHDMTTVDLNREGDVTGCIFAETDIRSNGKFGKKTRKEWLVFKPRTNGRGLYHIYEPVIMKPARCGIMQCSPMVKGISSEGVCLKTACSMQKNGGAKVRIKDGVITDCTGNNMYEARRWGGNLEGARVVVKNRLVLRD